MQGNSMPVTKQTPKNSKPNKGIINRIKPIGNFSKGINMSLYGKSGTGKTTLWSTFPGKILAIIASGGSSPGELRSVNIEENQGKIDQIIIESSTDIKELVEYQRETGAYETIVLDHATGLREIILREIKGLDEAPVQLSWGLATQQDWGQIGEIWKKYVRSLISLECNTVIVSHEQEYNTDVESQNAMITPPPVVGSALGKSCMKWLDGACDYIGQTCIRPESIEQTITVAGKSIKKQKLTGKMEYCLRVGPNELYTTKFRIPKGSELPDVIVDPDYSKIKELIG